jgi:DNA polymerase III delta prime subunit
VPWIVQDLVVREHLTLLYGPPGVGKSLFAAALAAGVARGEQVAGLTCEPGRVLVLDAENGASEIQRRLHLLGLPAQGIEYFDARHFDIRFYLDELEEWLVELRPDLLIFDSFRSLWSGDENDNREVAAAFRDVRTLLSLYEVGGLLLHHSKRGSNEFRGSSAIEAGCDLGVALGKDGANGVRYLSRKKTRIGQEPPKRWFRLAASEDRLSIEPAGRPSGEPPAKARASVKESLMPAVEEALSATPQSQAAVCRAVSRPAGDQTVRRALQDLAGAGRAHQERAGWVRVSGVSTPKGGCHPDTSDTSPGDAPERAA